LNIPRSCLAAIILYLLLVTCKTQAQVTVQFPDRSWSMLSTGGSVWIGTPNGLHRYRSEDNVWSAYGKQNGLLSSRITSLDISGDVLWIGQSAGLTAFDQRSNTMLHYDSGRGLAVGATRAVVFETDYVWAGGDKGAARYDKLIEEWQTIGAGKELAGTVVHAVTLSEDRVYLATDQGVSEYDPRYERWRLFLPPGEGRIHDAFVAGGRLWLLRDRDILRFDIVSRVFSPYTLTAFGGGDVREIIIQGNAFWLLTSNDLWLYDSFTDALRPFPELSQLPDSELKAVALTSDGSKLWFSTASGLSRYDRGNSSWTYYTPAGGMPDIDVHVLFPLGIGIATFTETSLVYYLESEDRWYELPLHRDDDGSTGSLSLDPGKGSYADFGKGIRLDLSGSRSSWYSRDPLGLRDDNSGEFLNHNDLKARLDLGGGRRISAVYNDADFEDVVYGAEYRGARDDVVQALQWGDMRVQGSGSRLQQDFGIFGVGGRAVYGDRTEKYGRSMLELQAQSGHKTTSTHTDVFQGLNRERQSTQTDADWLRRSLYHLRSDRLLGDLGEATVRVYGRLSPGTVRRSRDDLMATTIAGVTGDWRQQVEGEQYFIDRGKGILHLQWVSDEVVAVRISNNGVTEELLLRDTTTEHLEIRNHYSIGSDIIPATLRLRIIGPGGAETPLSQFGLDNNGDGRVDAEFMDYAKGLLRFPAAQPFPQTAYQRPPVSVYELEVRYESQNTGSYSLSKRRVIRGSERVTVDGIPVRPGEDYILDYSSGQLLFTRDGAVFDDSRVEISYEYVRNVTEERFTQANLTYSPSDLAQASIGGGSFTQQGSTSPIHFAQAGGEVRWQTQDFDLRVRPEYRHTVSDSATGAAAGLSASLSTDAARVSVLSSLRSDGYREAVPARYSDGRLGSDHIVSAEYDISPELRTFARYQGRAGKDSLTGIESSEQTSSGGVQWSRQDYPSLTLRGDWLDVTGTSVNTTRRGGRLDAVWTPSAELLALTGFSAARLSAFARITAEDAKGSLRNGLYRSQNYFLRTVLNPRPLFSVNLWYQGDLREKQTGEGMYVREYQTEKANLDLLMEHMDGLILGGRLTRELRSMQSSPTLFDRSSMTSLLTNVRIAPGTWSAALRPVVLYATASYAVTGYAANATDEAGLLLALFSGDTGERRSGSTVTGYESRLEWRPITGLLYSVAGMYRESSSELYSSAVNSGYWSMTHYAEWRPDNRSQYAMQFLFMKRLYSGINSEIQPSVWAEKRFSRLFLARLALHTTARRSENSYGVSEGYTLRPSATATLTLDDAPVIRRAEFRLDADYLILENQLSFYAAPPTIDSRRTLRANVYMDVYPHPVLFVRFRYLMHWDSGPGFNTYRFLGTDGWYQPEAELKIVMQL
jgi:hypothetical protein